METLRTNFLINTYLWWKFKLPTSCKYYVFLALLDHLKRKIFFVGQPWWPSIFRNWYHRKCSVRKVVLRNFAKFIGKRLSQGLFFNKFGGLRPETLLKKRLWLMCFLVNFAKFLRTFFLTEHFQWLLLNRFATNNRRNRPEVFCEIIASKNIAKFTGKHLSWSLLIMLQAESLQLKRKRLQHRCFTLNFVNFLRTTFLKKNCARQFL